MIELRYEREQRERGTDGLSVRGRKKESCPPLLSSSSPPSRRRSAGREGRSLGPLSLASGGVSDSAGGNIWLELEKRQIERF